MPKLKIRNKFINQEDLYGVRRLAKIGAQRRELEEVKYNDNVH